MGEVNIIVRMVCFLLGAALRKQLAGGSESGRNSMTGFNNHNLPVPWPPLPDMSTPVVRAANQQHQQRRWGAVQAEAEAAEQQHVRRVDGVLYKAVHARGDKLIRSNHAIVCLCKWCASDGEVEP